MEQKKLEKLRKFVEKFYEDYSGVRFDKWNYEDGCLLTAAIELYRVTGEARYRDFVVGYADRYVQEDGTILFYKQTDYNLDNIAPGRALIFACEQTGEERYKKAALLLLKQLEDQPRIKEGNFWHKKIYPNQVWLDGLFMAQPFYMACDTKYGKKARYVDICSQFRTVHKRMFEPEKGLYYHGYDESKSIFWANPENGCSANFWLRGMAWFMMGIVETLDEMDLRVYDCFQPLMAIYKEGIHGILKHRDGESGLFYQVADQPQYKGNYLETSGSAMLAASILKACRHRVLLTEKYQPVGESILEAIVDTKLAEQEGRTVLCDTCRVAGLGPEPGRRDGSIGYYLSEPVTVNDKKGMAALFMAYAQYLYVNGEA